MIGQERKRLYESAKSAALKLADYFDGIDFTLTDERGNPVYKVTDVTRALREVGGILAGLKELEEKVEKDDFKKEQTRKGRKINPFERTEK